MEGKERHRYTLPPYRAVMLTSPRRADQSRKQRLDFAKQVALGDSLLHNKCIQVWRRETQD